MILYNILPCSSHSDGVDGGIAYWENHRYFEIAHPTFAKSPDLSHVVIGDSCLVVRFPGREVRSSFDNTVLSIFLLGSRPEMHRVTTCPVIAGMKNIEGHFYTRDEGGESMGGPRSSAKLELSIASPEATRDPVPARINATGSVDLLPKSFHVVRGILGEHGDLHRLCHDRGRSIVARFSLIQYTVLRQA